MKSSVTPNEAQYVVEHLLGNRTINTSHVRGALDARTSEITTLEARLRSLRSASEHVAAVLPASRISTTSSASASDVTVQFVPDAPVVRRKAKITPERRKQMQEQGKYLGLIRRFPASQRGKFKKLLAKNPKARVIKVMEIALR